MQIEGIISGLKECADHFTDPVASSYLRDAIDTLTNIEGQLDAAYEDGKAQAMIEADEAFREGKAEAVTELEAKYSEADKISRIFIRTAGMILDAGYEIALEMKDWSHISKTFGNLSDQNQTDKGLTLRGYKPCETEPEGEE